MNSSTDSTFCKGSGTNDSIGISLNSKDKPHSRAKIVTFLATSTPDKSSLGSGSVYLLILVAKLIKAPFFFLAVGSQANVGGAASAPIVASAFHPSLATVGVLLAVFGYAIGTIAAIGCTILLELAAPV